ncbi:MAG: hypothetical protein KJZ87_03395 [Thermoguttaceae bacterium]|nr:hypothetical protein [Thermoguttaceae bacterium]
MSLPFSRRVDENRVAEILALIGSQHFYFADGTEAHLAMPAPRLNVNLLFTEGEIVDIVQRLRTGEPGGGLACYRLDRLEQRES